MGRRMGTTKVLPMPFQSASPMIVIPSSFPKGNDVMPMVESAFEEPEPPVIVPIRHSANDERTVVIHIWTKRGPYHYRRGWGRDNDCSVSSTP